MHTIQPQKFVTGATLVAFGLLVFVGLFDCANPVMASQMNMAGSDHAMTDCVPGKDCGMDINKHIQIWQGMITTNLTPGFFGVFISLILITGLLSFVRKLFSVSRTSLLLARYLYYDRDHRESPLYNYFIQIFSRGILQPKLFA